MVPHILGIFPCMAAWVVIVCHYIWISADLREVTTARIPSGIEGALVGTVVLFWSFTAPQIIFQHLPPGMYWGTELIYVILSLTAKLYLGLFLLINVISVDGNIEQQFAGAGEAQ